MPPKSKNNDADDVLDFINSLPDSKSGTPKPKENDKADNNGKDEDFLEFLDELTAHEKSKPSTPIPNSKFEPKKKGEQVNEKESTVKTKQTKNDKKEANVASKDTKEIKKEVKQEPPAVETKEELNDHDEEENDTIGSISTWWNNEGSNKVSSLWGSITSNAQTLSEQTYQLASTTSNQISQQRQKLIENSDQEQILNISSKLNSMLLNMSHQITQGLMDDSDELLNILLIYDLYNINYLDKLCYEKFNQVMNQVEGGINVSVNNFNHKDELNKDRVDLNLFYGKMIDGEKLCFANLESSIKDYLKIVKLSEEKDEDDEPKEKEEKEEEEPKADANTDEAEAKEREEIEKVNKSNIFISIQPITTKSNQDDSASSNDEATLGPILIESNNSDSFSFTVILKDITNNITIITKTQPFPLKWAKWLNGEMTHEFKEFEDIDPSEWIKNWVRDGLSLSFGVLAQEYVIKRMGF